MQCPSCSVTLLLSEKQGVEIDYCPECRGVWLDRGELEKITERLHQAERSLDETTPHTLVDDSDRWQKNERVSSKYRDRSYDDDDKHFGRRKKKSRFDFFDDILDF